MKFKRVALLILLFALAVFSQPVQHTVSFTILDTVNPVGTVYNIYRVSTPCNGLTSLPASAKMANFSGLTTKNPVDNTVVMGTTYCYAVTAQFQTVEGSQSNLAQASITVSVSSVTISIVIQ